MPDPALLLRRLGLPALYLDLVVFTLPATVFFHAFWTLDGAEIGGEYLHSMKNLGLAGDSRPGPGRFSLDGWRSRRAVAA